MTPTQESPETTEQIRTGNLEPEQKPRPWTAPDFIERSTCAEIGAYSFHEK